MPRAGKDMTIVWKIHRFDLYVPSGRLLFSQMYLRRSRRIQSEIN